MHYDLYAEDSQKIVDLQEQLDIARDIARLLAIRSPQTVDGRTAAVIASWPKSDGKTLTPGYTCRKPT